MAQLLLFLLFGDTVSVMPLGNILRVLCLTVNGLTVAFGAQLLTSQHLGHQRPCNGWKADLRDLRRLANKQARGTLRKPSGPV